jgi:hypothetical protein
MKILGLIKIIYGSQLLSKSKKFIKSNLVNLMRVMQIEILSYGKELNYLLKKNKKKSK